MKKVIASVLSLMLVLALSVSVFATGGFVKSPTLDKAPTVEDVTVETGTAPTVTVTPYDDRHDLATEDKADLEVAYNEIKAAADLKELKVAVENGSAGQDAAVAAGITNIVAVQDQAAALMEVGAGTSDACIIDITMANAMTGEGTDYADLAIGISLESEEYGVGFRKDSDLTAMFNAFMDKLIADGTLPALAEKYSLTLAG